MFVALGILLSTIFTPVVPSFNTNAPTNCIFKFNQYYTFFQGTYYEENIPEIQTMDFSVGNLDLFLTDYAREVDTSSPLVGYHNCPLFSLSYTSPDGIVFRDYIYLSVNYKIFEIHPSQGVTVYRTTEYTFGLLFNDFDYPEVPTFNFTMSYYWSKDTDYLHNTAHQYKFDRDYINMTARELDDYSYASDYSIDYIIPFYFHIDFYWFTQEIYDETLLGMYPSQNYNLGYQNGKKDGLYEGKQDFMNSLEYQNILQSEYDKGKQAGISLGREQVIEQGQTATIIFNGIISIALLPVNVFLKMLNLEVFGINLGALVSSLLTICVIIILARMIFGKNGE